MLSDLCVVEATCAHAMQAEMSARAIPRPSVPLAGRTIPDRTHDGSMIPYHKKPGGSCLGFKPRGYWLPSLPVVRGHAVGEVSCSLNKLPLTGLLVEAYPLL